MSNSYRLSTSEGPPRFTYDGRCALNIAGARIAILQSKFYSEYVDRCVDKYCSILLNCGVKRADIVHEILPGTIELPLACGAVARHLRPDAIACFGGVVDTDAHHARMIMDIFSHGIAAVMLEVDVPILVGVIAVPQLELLKARCADDDRNHGIKIALATTEVVAFRRKYAGGD